MKITLLTALVILLVVAQAIHEIPMAHRKRTPRESKMLLEYMGRGPFAEKINKILAKIFPSELTPNIYAYPEVKILNYLDAQYYGYLSIYPDKSILELLLNNSELFSIQDLPTFGFPPKSADSHLPATYTDTSTHLRAPLTFTTEHISTSPMDQEQFQVS
jgi:hypothetical protein